MSAQYKVDLAFTFEDMDVWWRRTDACVQAAGNVPYDAGTGFGERDMQFFYDTRDEAAAAERRLRATGIAFVYIDVEEYVAP